MIKKKQDFFEYVSENLTEFKKQRILDISSNRTDHITVVLENTLESKDNSGAIRTCECFGINSVYVIENTIRYKVNPDVAMGSFKWLNIHRFNKRENNNSLDSINYLKKKGYKIVSLVPDRNAKPLNELDLSKKTALFFGSEEDGLSSEVLNNSDELITIPMKGKVESFNLSASVGMSLHNIIYKLNKDKFDYKLKEDELLDLRLFWIKKLLKSYHIHEKRFNELELE